MFIMFIVMIKQEDLKKRKYGLIVIHNIIDNGIANACFPDA